MPGPRSRTADLSQAALQLGAELGTLTRIELAGWLYAFNREPLSPSLFRAFPDERAVLSYLVGEERSGILTGVDGWEMRAADEPWRSWTRRAARGGDGRASFKLYVSPPVSGAMGIVADIVDVLPATGATSFKICRRPADLARPDKLVLYFDSAADLAPAAAALERRMGGRAVQGVPFSCSIGDGDLLSWGWDPPAPSGGAALSWRAWLCGELAGALVGDTSPTSEGRIAGALKRLRRLGVDTDAWRPSRSTVP